MELATVLEIFASHLVDAVANLDAGLGGGRPWDDSCNDDCAWLDWVFAPGDADSDFVFRELDV